MLGQRRRRWLIIEELTAPTIFIVFVWYIASGSVIPANTTHRPNVGPMLSKRRRRRPTLVHHWFEVSCLLESWRCR